MAIGVMLPFLWLVFGSFKTYQDLIANPWFPHRWIIKNYVTVFSQGGIGRAFVNSAIVAVAQVFFTCTTSVLLGYVFAKYRFLGKDVLFVILLSTLMVPLGAVVVPLYLLLAGLNLTNNIVGLIVISMWNMFGVYLLRQNIRGVSDEYIDAARMEGAGELRIVLRVIVPLARAPIAALAILTFLSSWDNYLFPSIVLTSASSKTLPLALQGLQGLFWARYELFCAGAMLAIVPVMVIYTIFQRQFIRGLSFGGLKE
jgi:ABC-type glycerol-3-phosphate transport system permease component